MLDSGSKLNLTDEKFLKIIREKHNHFDVDKRTTVFATCNGNTVLSRGMVVLPVQFGKWCVDLEFHVMSACVARVILGMKFMENYCDSVSFVEQRLTLRLQGREWKKSYVKTRPFTTTDIYSVCVTATTTVAHRTVCRSLRERRCRRMP